jgi:hypothetical protein
LCNLYAFNFIKEKKQCVWGFACVQREENGRRKKGGKIMFGIQKETQVFEHMSLPTKVKIDV